ncbi:two-component system, unclassified family, sensor histidine kinase and response regulator [Saccharicrinis carchari]|uniref:histidine kinase n=1 Tax=Saccharicrinis carchari TaxID=1168039 RepID=A0A521F3P3_SACCC|nr:response regulator [Saccharicrinis carchari]SMO90815.1 two-component system, unclassified family, sensor histidine kinase and response regulator [Saccharicrinis carchari]
MEINDKKQYKILIVDDRQKNIQVLGSLLRQENYIIGVATNGEQALEILIGSNDYDLILLDVNMPVMDGFEACRAIRVHEDLKEIPIIFLTAMVDTDSIVTGFEAGGQDYVTKPFNSNELLAKVNTHLELKHSKDQLRKVNQWLEDKVLERTKELRHSHLKLQKAYQELNVLDKSKSEFLAIISHQINTPLNGILGFIGVLKHEITDTHLQEMFKYLEISAHRLDSFSKVSLKITRLRTRTLPVDKKQIAIEDLIRSSQESLVEKIKSKNIAFDIGGAGNMIKGDPELVEFCIESILDNAINYSPNNGIVQINISSAGNNTRFAVIDRGNGFNPRSLNNLFELFVPDQEHSEENKGLDLALAKLIMDAHEGTIEVLNNEGKGATVILTFPN